MSRAEQITDDLADAIASVDDGSEMSLAVAIERSVAAAAAVVRGLDPQTFRDVASGFEDRIRVARDVLHVKLVIGSEILGIEPRSDPGTVGKETSSHDQLLNRIMTAIHEAGEIEKAIRAVRAIVKKRPVPAGAEGEAFRRRYQSEILGAAWWFKILEQVGKQLFGIKC